jgi:hypothetical protein
VISLFKRIRIPLIVCFLLLLGTAQTRPAERQNHADAQWHALLHELLPMMGHRNWIAVVDSAYPLQVSPGIETIETGSDQLEVVRRVLHEVAEAPHLRPVVFTDAEMKAVPEDDAPGVSYYRDSLNHFLDEFQAGNIALGTLERHSLPHEEIISKLDQAGQIFHILVLKTRMTIPYTSVFLRLDCGYWSDEQEKRLREKMGK